MVSFLFLVCYGHPPAMVGAAILFYRYILDLFSPPNLRGRLADCHQTCLVVTGFVKFGQKFGWPLPHEI